MTGPERVELERLREENRALHARVAELEATVAGLLERDRLRQVELDELRRQAARQAAPFRRRDARKVPADRKRRPGRPPGHQGARRAVPTHVDEHVEVPLPACPGCGGPVADVTPVVQHVEEAPPVRVHVTRLVTYRGRCAACGEVRSTHPLQRCAAAGAAGVLLGPRAMALALASRQQFGLTLRTACRVLRLLCGVRLSPGGLAHAARRAATRLAPAHDALRGDVRGAAAVFADETSWYVGGPGHWLWTFTTADATLYRVDKSRGRAVVTETLGAAFAGVLVSDCLAAYEGLPYRAHKCLAHHQRAIAAARARPDTTDPSYLDEWKLLFTMVAALWRHRPTLGEAEFTRQRGHLGAWLDRLLAPPRGQPGDEAIRRRIGRRRGVVLGCLDDPAAEPTNNRAERALRPAVIARKLSCGHRTEAGAAAWAQLTSLAVTCAQRGQEFATWLAESLPVGVEVQPIPAATR